MAGSQGGSSRKSSMSMSSSSPMHGKKKSSENGGGPDFARRSLNASRSMYASLCAPIKLLHIFFLCTFSRIVFIVDVFHPGSLLFYRLLPLIVSQCRL